MYKDFDSFDFDALLRNEKSRMKEEEKNRVKMSEEELWQWILEESMLEVLVDLGIIDRNRPRS